MGSSGETSEVRTIGSTETGAEVTLSQVVPLFNPMGRGKKTTTKKLREGTVAKGWWRDGVTREGQ